MCLHQILGLCVSNEDPQITRVLLQLYLNLKPSSSGPPACEEGQSSKFLEVANKLLSSYREKSRLLSGYLCPPDQRIQSYLDDYLADVDEGAVPRLPENTFQSRQRPRYGGKTQGTGADRERQSAADTGK